MTRRLAAIVALLVIVELTSGCSALSAQADTTQYFVLTPIKITERMRCGSFEGSVGVGPLTIADHLEDYLVTRLTDEEIAISDTDRWSEPLHEALGGVLRQNLVALLHTERIIGYPWNPSTPPDLAITVEVMQFERTTMGSADLKARWSIERGSDRASLLTEETTIVEPLRGTDSRAAVAALSSGLGQLSQKIATQVCRMPLGRVSLSPKER